MRKYVTVLALLAVILFGLTIWPGLYRYEKLYSNSGWPLEIREETLIRTNRLTGQTDELTKVGWRRR